MTADARRLVVPVAIIAAVLLFLLINPWLKVEPGSTLSTIVTVAFWILAIAVIVLMYIDSRDPETPQVEVESPRFAKYLFGNTRAGLFWLPIRLFVGFAWLSAGWGKWTGTGWTDGGAALLGLLAERGRGPRGRPSADHLRLVPDLHPVADRQRRPDLDGRAHSDRRNGRWARAAARGADRLRGVLRLC